MQNKPITDEVHKSMYNHPANVPPPAVPDLTALSISQIASVIRRDWKKVYFGAVPYLSAMQSLETIDGNYGADSAREMVLYFLSNATTWKGPVARAVKLELNKRLKAARK